MTRFSRYTPGSTRPRANRYIMVLKPLQPYVDWVLGLPDPERKEGDIVFSLEEAQLYHRTSYLIPYAWEWDVVEEWLNANFDLFFQSELRGIEEDATLWPTPRTLELFDAWFEAEIFDAPLDATREPVFGPKTAKKRGR